MYVNNSFDGLLDKSTVIRILLQEEAHQCP